jgi:hypothetical protein
MHAFLIGVYKSPEYLKELISSLDSDKSNFYIHINKKNEDCFYSFKAEMEKKGNVIFVDNIEVKWGGSSFLHSVIKMYDSALKNKENKYFHLLTGQDALARPLNDLFKLFEVYPESVYLNITSFPNKEWNYGGKDRLFRYNLYDLFNIRGQIGGAINKFYILLQKVFFIKRHQFDFEKLLCGIGWWSMGREPLEFVSKRLADKKILKRLEHTFAPDEFIFQTILFNSPYANDIVNNNLRYQSWEGSHGSPEILNEKHIDKILSSKAFFVRKIDVNLSAKLLCLLKGLIK